MIKLVLSISVLIYFMPFIANAQLKEFDVSEMPRPEVSIVQANADFPDNALLLIYSSIDNLNFRSSIGRLNKQTYNPTASRYEVLVDPLKQMIFVSKPGFMELKVSIINPDPKDIFYYKVEEKKLSNINIEKGILKLFTDPKECEITLNGIKVIEKTPYSGELNAVSYQLNIIKTNYETIDTIVFIVQTSMT